MEELATVDNLRETHGLWNKVAGDRVDVEIDFESSIVPSTAAHGLSGCFPEHPMHLRLL